MKALHIVAFTLLVVGGLNWLLTAFNYNVVELIFGAGGVSRTIYVLVGLSAIWEVAMHKKNCRACSGGGMM